MISNDHDLFNKVNEAIRKIEEENEELRDVLTIFSNRSISNPVLYKLMLKIDQLNNRRVKIYKLILEHLANNLGASFGECYTPEFVNQLLVKLIDVKYGTFYDGTAGFCTTMINAAEQAETNGYKLDLYGQELKQKTWAIGKMNLIIHGYDDSKLKQGDTLVEPKFTDNGSLKTFDYICMNPPFGLSDWGVKEAENDLYGRFRFGIPSKSHGDMAFVLHALASLKENGKAALILPQGVLFRGGKDAKIREKLIEADVIEGVIGLPSKSFFPYSGVQTAIIILNKSKSEAYKNNIFMIDIEKKNQKTKHTALSENDIKKIVETYHTKSIVEGYSKWISHNEIEDQSLLTKNYFIKDEVETRLGNFKVNRKGFEYSVNTTTLKNCGTFYRGLNIHAYKTKQKESTPEESTHKIIQLSNVEDGEIKLDGAILYNARSLKNPDAYEVNEGDVLISSRGKSIKIAVVPAGIKNALLSHDFIGFKPNKGVDPYFIKHYLESPIGKNYLAFYQKGSNVSVLKIKDIENIPVPKLSLAQQQELSKELVSADLELKKKIKEAKEEHRKIFLEVYGQMGILENIEDLTNDK